ncbi:MAG: hypothetical protein ACP6IQ_10560 [Candidatus Njordarchaeia archaeon]
MGSLGKGIATGVAQGLTRSIDIWRKQKLYEEEKQQRKYQQNINYLRQIAPYLKPEEFELMAKQMNLPDEEVTLFKPIIGIKRQPDIYGQISQALPEQRADLALQYLLQGQINKGELSILAKKFPSLSTLIEEPTSNIYETILQTPEAERTNLVLKLLAEDKLKRDILPYLAKNISGLEQFAYEEYDPWEINPKMAAFLELPKGVKLSPKEYFQYEKAYKTLTKQKTDGGENAKYNFQLKRIEKKLSAKEKEFNDFLQKNMVNENLYDYMAIESGTYDVSDVDVPGVWDWGKSLYNEEDLKKQKREIFAKRKEELSKDPIVKKYIEYKNEIERLRQAKDRLLTEGKPLPEEEIFGGTSKEKKNKSKGKNAKSSSSNVSERDKFIALQKAALQRIERLMQKFEEGTK